MGRLTQREQLNILYALGKAVSNAAGYITSLVRDLLDFKLVRANVDDWAKKEFKYAATALKWRGYSPDDLAAADHTHTEYYLKTEPVDFAQRVWVRDGFYAPSELAPVDHNHDGYYLKEGEFKVAAYKLNGIDATEFALKDHDHDAEYYLKDDIVDLAYEIGGYKPDDFARKDHDHADMYYLANEPVQDALVLEDASGTYTADAFAPADHNHDDRYYTVEEFKETFLLKDEPFWSARKVKLRLYKYIPDMNTLDPMTETSEYELLQSPFVKKGLRPEAVVQATTVYEGEYEAYVIVLHDIGVSAGRYVTYTLNLPPPYPSVPNILGALAAIKTAPGAEDIPVQAPIFLGWSNNKIMLYAFPFAGAGSGVVVDLIVFVEA